jgi:hypothetical protein
MAGIVMEIIKSGERSDEALRSPDNVAAEINTDVNQKGEEALLPDPAKTILLFSRHRSDS